MQELTQIETSSAHRCKTPRIDRWHVLEPVTGRWTWLTIFSCCSQVFEELTPLPERVEDDEVQKAA